MSTILVVEDEKTLRDTLTYNLQRQGYTVEVAGDGQAALDAARRLHPNLDLIVLDLMLPVLDGFEVCRILRHEMSVPIILLTARDDEIDHMVGLEIGADDYITKPFSLRELAARVKAHLRRERLIRDELNREGVNREQNASLLVSDTNQVLRFDTLVINLTRQEGGRSVTEMGFQHFGMELSQANKNIILRSAAGSLRLARYG